MAVRFDASTDRLLRTSGLLDYNSAYTWMGWAYLVSNLGTTSTFWVLDDNSANNVDWLRTNTDGLTIQLRAVSGGSGNSVNGTTLSTGVWYHLALVREDASTLKAYLDGALDATNTTSVTGRTAATRQEHGGRSASTSPSDSRVAAIKAWSAALTQAEIQQERWFVRPIRTANLHGFWPCFPGSAERLIDYSGNGRDWGTAGTLTDEDPPPVGWGSDSPPVVYMLAAASTDHLPFSALVALPGFPLYAEV